MDVSPPRMGAVTLKWKLYRKAYVGPEAERLKVIGPETIKDVILPQVGSKKKKK